MSIIKYTALILCFLSFDVFSNLNLIKDCHNCNEDGYIKTAKSVISNGAKVVVFDAINKQVRLYKITQQSVDDNIDEITATSLAVPQEIITSYLEAMVHREAYLNDIKNDFGTDTTSLDQIDSNTLFVLLFKNNLLTFNTTKPINTYNFMLTSFIRRQTYEAMTSKYPNYFKFITSWHQTISAVNTSVGDSFSASENLNPLAVNSTLNFKDGSWVRIKYNNEDKTIEVLNGVDVAGNDIPSKAISNIGGQYAIAGTEHYNDFKDYLSHLWVVTFIDSKISDTKACSVSCKPSSTSKFICTLNCR